MAKASEFSAFLKEMVSSGSLYIWGAQGEFVGNLTVGQIITAETSAKNAARVFKLLASRLEVGYPYEKIMAFDCSGLGVKYFEQRKLINGDMTADGLYKMCTKIKRSQLREGDMVFICTATDKATHVGYYIGDGLVIEAAGRDLGVVMRAISKNGWTNYGRPPFWEDAEERELSLKTPMMRGDDVKKVQEALRLLGYKIDTDGVFGEKTQAVVKEFQKSIGLTVDGVVGAKTRKALGVE